MLLMRSREAFHAGADGGAAHVVLETVGGAGRRGVWGEAPAKSRIEMLKWVIFSYQPMWCSIGVRQRRFVFFSLTQCGTPSCNSVFFPSRWSAIRRRRVF